MTHALFLLCAAGGPVDPPAAGPLPVIVKAEPDAKLNALFRQKDGWVGGDGAFSVQLSDTRMLWLFSDTWVGSVRDGKRKDVRMVNNTVGVQDGAGADIKLTFFVQQKDGKPAALFVPPDGKGWFWLFAGHYAGGKLHVFLPRFEKNGKGGAFGFNALDMWLGTVSNPTDEPTKWKTEYAKVPFVDYGAGRKVVFGSAVMPAGAHVYVYGHEETPTRFAPRRKLLVARAPKDKLTDFDSWRFLSNDEWKADAKDATPLVEGLGAEFSVSYVPGLKRYALVYTVYTEGGLSEKIVGRFALSPDGPWSDSVLLYTCPEMKKDRKVFTYAGKAHPHLAGDNELVISYATNAYELGPVINNADLYWPTFVRVKLK
jgi:hypothetical protein